MKSQKKIKKLLFILTLFSIVASCNNEINDQSHQKSLLVPPGLMQEPIIQNMINDLSSCNISLNSNNILKFPSIEKFINAIDILENANLLFDKDSLYCDDAVYSAFEYYYNFTSLRAKIEDNIFQLENNDALFENNNPDDHFIINNTIRSLLSEDCVVMISNTYYIFFDDFIIGVLNGDWRNVELVLSISQSPNEDDLLFLCNSNEDIFYIDGDTKSKCTVNFSYTRSLTNPYQFYFKNHSFCLENNFSVLWDFGDGTTSTELNPIHTFSSSFDSSNVLLHIFYDNNDYKIIKNIKLWCNSDFTYQVGSDGKVAFTSTSSPGENDQIANYSWNFGDFSNVSGADKTKVTHQYSSNGTYLVKLIITTKDECTHESSYIVTIENKLCCKNNDHRIVTIDVGPKNKIKSHLRVTNGLMYIHRIDAKTVCYYVKNNGSLKREKADELGAGWKGEIYPNGNGDGCGSSVNTELSKIKKNRKYFIYSYSTVYSKIRVLPNSLTATYFVYDANDNVNKRQFGAKIHQKSCN